MVGIAFVLAITWVEPYVLGGPATEPGEPEHAAPALKAVESGAARPHPRAHAPARHADARRAA